MKNKIGFTLIELLAVIVVVAVIATIGIFSVAKIIDKARIKALTDTAFAARKATLLDIANKPNLLFIDGVATLDLTPGNSELNIPRGANADIMDMGKDPWGKDYKLVIAKITRISEDNVKIDIYFTLQNDKIWLLAAEETEMILLTNLESIADINGNGYIGNTISAGETNPTDAQVTYQWQVTDTINGTYSNIANATTNSYELTVNELNKYVRVKVTAKDKYYGVVYSDAIGAIKYLVTSVANITGGNTVGSTLTAGAVSPVGATVSYQWQKSSTVGGTYTNINGATSSTFVTTSSEKDYYIKVAVTGTGQYGGTVLSQATPKIVTPTLDLLVVGGGGGGGFAHYGGGGGAGQCRQTTYNATPGSVTVTIGAGGSAGAVNRGSNGGTTSFGAITALGGGGGGGGSLGAYTSSYPGASGASGGGAAEQSTGGIGTAGFNGGSGGLSGWAGNGGGGAGGAGGSVTGAGIAGVGGAGISSDITGTTLWYCGGGGGGASNNGGLGGSGVGGRGAYSSYAATAPTANRGSGGGGGRSTSGTAGSAGVVIVRYPTGSITATGGIITTSGAYTIHTFNSSGTFTIQ